MSFLFAVIICQFGVKAPRASGNRNRSHQVTNHVFIYLIRINCE